MREVWKKAGKTLKQNIKTITEAKKKNFCMENRLKFLRMLMKGVCTWVGRLLQNTVIC